MDVPPIESIQLTPDEQALIERIDFRPEALRERSAVHIVCSAASDLTASLLAREAIPKVRLRYSADPDFNIGGHGRSIQAIFERSAFLMMVPSMRPTTLHTA